MTDQNSRRSASPIDLSFFDAEELKKMEENAAAINRIVAISTECIEECFDSPEDRHTAAFVFAIQMAVYSFSQFRELEDSQVKELLAEMTEQINSQYRCGPAAPVSRIQ